MAQRNGIPWKSDPSRRVTCGLAALGLSIAFPGGAAFADAFCPPTALVLAFDSSGSITREEYILQTKGTALALMEPSLLRLIAEQGGISLSAVIWSDTSSGVEIIPWHIVWDDRTMATFAEQVATARQVPGGNTDIGNGLWRALDLLGEVEGCALRRMINVSGDGRETPHARGRANISVSAARSRAEAQGVVINGLAIADEDPDLSAYFENQIMVGPGSFVMEIAGYEDFQRAMAMKLHREISEPLVGELGVEAGPAIEFSALFDGTEQSLRN